MYIKEIGFFRNLALRSQIIRSRIHRFTICVECMHVTSSEHRGSIRCGRVYYYVVIVANFILNEPKHILPLNSSSNHMSTVPGSQACDFYFCGHLNNNTIKNCDQFQRLRFVSMLL